MFGCILRNTSTFNFFTTSEIPLLIEIIDRCLLSLGQSILGLNRQSKQLIVLSLDVVICVLTVWLAFYLRLGDFFPFYWSLATPLLWPALASILLAIPIFIKFGLYQAIFRYGGLSTIEVLTKASLVYGVAFALIFTVIGVEDTPRTIGLIQPVLVFLFVGASRVLAHVWLGGRYERRVLKGLLPQMLIYGAGSAGRQLASAMAGSLEMRVVGFLDDDSTLQGQVLNGLPIYNPAELAKIVPRLSITDVLLAMPSVSRKRRNDILAGLSSLKIAVRTLPGLNEVVSGKITLNDIRELDLDDLLGREPNAPNSRLFSATILNKTVLVTGAGGSIGSELCRQILQASPRRLLLVDMSEFQLYKIEQELRNTINEKGNAFDSIEIVSLLASVCDETRIQEVMSTWRPHTVYHAAAYKHVPLVEHNPSEAVLNNILGTKVCAEIAKRSGVDNFVLVSTDKAVRPTNIMGATKRVAEMVLQALAQSQQKPPSELFQSDREALPRPNTVAGTIFSIVRFGNVLGSSGSVVPLFRQQIKVGGPLTLTHLDVTRYFMTISEAAQLVIQAGAMSVGGEVFVLDMGKPVKIIDLAYRIVELSGLTVQDGSNPDGDIEIRTIGLRPGEKLYEELLIGDDPKPTQHSRIMKANEPFLRWGDLEAKLERLKCAARINEVEQLRRLLTELVPGYVPDDEIVDWVYMAKKNFAATSAERTC